MCLSLLRLRRQQSQFLLRSIIFIFPGLKHPSPSHCLDTWCARHPPCEVNESYFILWCNENIGTVQLKEKVPQYTETLFCKLFCILFLLIQDCVKAHLISCLLPTCEIVHFLPLTWHLTHLFLRGQVSKGLCAAEVTSYSAVCIIEGFYCHGALTRTEYYIIYIPRFTMFNYLLFLGYFGCRYIHFLLIFCFTWWYKTHVTENETACLVMSWCDNRHGI